MARQLDKSDTALYAFVELWELDMFVLHFRLVLAEVGKPGYDWGDFLIHARHRCDVCSIVLGEIYRRKWNWTDDAKISSVIRDIQRGMK